MDVFSLIPFLFSNSWRSFLVSLWCQRLTHNHCFRRAFTSNQLLYLRPPRKAAPITGVRHLLCRTLATVQNEVYPWKRPGGGACQKRRKHSCCLWPEQLQHSQAHVAQCFRSTGTKKVNAHGCQARAWMVGGARVSRKKAGRTSICHRHDTIRKDY